jgi:hypothetical protein
MQAPAYVFQGLEFRESELLLLMTCGGSPADRWMSEPRMAFSRANQANRHMTSTDRIDKSLEIAFRNALLLCANMRDAEAAVMDAIEAVDDVNDAAFQQEAIRDAIRRSEHSAANLRERIPSLPAELSRVLLLPKRLRHCFVLRILLGFTAKKSAEMLGLASCDINDVLRMSIQLLPLATLNPGERFSLPSH